ncbi:MAG: hypothetical protein FJ146_04990 [Deltaproteobacteria bacterium]|nr:hypothetical protein [Deltaproteobacteria bacterium]
MKKIKLFVSLAVITFSLGSGHAKATGGCVQFPEQAEAPVVQACEGETHYTFNVAGRETSYAKDSYRARLARVLNDWFASKGLALPPEGEVEFWLAVPETNPAATQARAAFYWSGGAVVAYLPLVPDSWKLTDRQVAVLDSEQRYPGSYGHRPGTLLVHVQEDVPHAAVVDFLAEHGVDDPRALGKDRYVYEVDPFLELHAKSAVETHPQAKQLIKNISVNSVVEWVAMRQRAFAFSLPSS